MIKYSSFIALISTSLLLSFPLAARAETAEVYRQKIDACRNKYGTSKRTWSDWLEFQACLIDANTSFLAQQVGKFVEVPNPLLADNTIDGFMGITNEDIGTLMAQNVYLINQITTEPSGVNDYNVGIGNPITPTSDELYIFAAEFNDLNQSLEFNQLDWLSLGSFQSNSTDWDVVLDTSFLSPDSLYTIAYTFESNPNEFFPDTTTPMGLKSIVIVDEIPPEPVSEPTTTLSLLSLGILGAGATLKRKLKHSNSIEKENTKVG